MADEIKEKVYCYEKPADNTAMWATLMANREKGASPLETMAMMNNGGFGGNGWNNPLR